MSDYFMKLAFEESLKAKKLDNVPVGAVMVCNNKVIAKAYNKKNSNNISILHAELICIYKSCKKLNRWILDDCELYVTMKPCNMCYYAIAESRIRKVYYLMDSNYKTNLEKNGKKVKFDKMKDKFNYSNIINNFFKNIRNK